VNLNGMEGLFRGVSRCTARASDRLTPHPEKARWAVFKFTLEMAVSRRRVTKERRAGSLRDMLWGRVAVMADAGDSRAGRWVVMLPVRKDEL